MTGTGSAVREMLQRAGPASGPGAAVVLGHVHELGVKLVVGGQVPGQRAGHLHGLAAARVGEAQAGGMQGLAR